MIAESYVVKIANSIKSDIDHIEVNSQKHGDFEVEVVDKKVVINLSDLEIKTIHTIDLYDHQSQLIYSKGLDLTLVDTLKVDIIIEIEVFIKDV